VGLLLSPSEADGADRLSARLGLTAGNSASSDTGSAPRRPSLRRDELSLTTIRTVEGQTSTGPSLSGSTGAVALGLVCGPGAAAPPTNRLGLLMSGPRGYIVMEKLEDTSSVAITNHLPVPVPKLVTP
jgi:hypothetical protein